MIAAILGVQLLPTCDYKSDGPTCAARARHTSVANAAEPVTAARFTKRHGNPLIEDARQRLETVGEADLRRQQVPALRIGARRPRRRLAR